MAAVVVLLGLPVASASMVLPVAVECHDCESTPVDKPGHNSCIHTVSGFAKWVNPGAELQAFVPRSAEVRYFSEQGCSPEGYVPPIEHPPQLS